MKQILIILLGCCLLFKGYSQTYHPIPSDSVYWIETSGQLMDFGGATCVSTTYHYVYPYNTSVLLDSNYYIEFHQNTFTSYQFIMGSGSCPSSGSGSGFYAYVRNDSANKQVYIYDNATHQEHLIYDFNMQPGDTITPPSYVYGGPGGFCDYDTFFVSMIDSVDLGGEYRKRFRICHSQITNDTINIVEGVGNDLGFMFAVFCPFEDGSSLICYHYKALEYIPPALQGMTNCIFDMSIEFSPISVNDIIIRESSTTYWIKNEDNHSIYLSCYDALGKCILNRSFMESGYLDFSNFPSGLYFIQIVYEGKNIKPYKFIIQG